MRLRKFLTGILSIAITLPVLATELSISVYADDGVVITRGNFPDNNFYTYVKNFDTNSDGILDSSEISKVTSINLSLSSAKISDGIGPGSAKLDYSKPNNEIRNLIGIEYFTSLEKLDISYNQNIKSVDLSNNTKLTKLIVHNTAISSLSLFTLPNLTELRAWNTNLESINITKNPKLQYIDVAYTKVNTLNVANNPKLKEFANSTPSTKTWLSENYHYYNDGSSTINCNTDTIISVAIESGVALTEENFGDINFCNYLANKLDANGDGILSKEEARAESISIPERHYSVIKGLSYIDGLEKFTAGYLIKSKVDELDLSNCSSLTVVNVLSCGLSKLDLTNCTALKELRMDGNNISSLDFSKFTELSKLWISDNKLTSLDLSNNSNLRELYCSNNLLSSIDVSHFPNLKRLSISSNPITTLDISNVNLTDLYCDNTKITELDLSKQTSLIELDISRCAIKNLDLSNNHRLTHFYCDGSSIETIDLSGCKDILVLSCVTETLRILDIREYPKLLTGYNTVSRSGVIYDNDCIEYGIIANGSTNIENFRLRLRVHPDTYIIAKDEDVANAPTPTPIPTAIPSTAPTSAPAGNPTSVPGNNMPTVAPTVPGTNPTNEPTNAPVAKPTSAPTSAPTTAPSKTPSSAPTSAPNGKPTVVPTTAPANKPTTVPTTAPANKPESTPVAKPTTKPTSVPAAKPTSAPSGNSNVKPTTAPGNTVAPNVTTTTAPSKPQTGVSDKAGTVEDFAERLYTTCLGRDAEEAGKDYWTSELKGGKTGAEVAEGFFFSPEFIGFNLDNEEYITRLYRTFMGREPDKDGIDYWSSEMDNGKDRKFVFDGFVNSPEWADICLTYGIRSGGLAKPTFEKEASAKVIAFAERLYTTCLGREAEKEGLEWWSAELANLRQTGTVAASGFFYSPEFISLKKDDEEYVTRLYRTFMGREPEEAGFKFWVDELKSGKDRQYVFDGFSAAPEFANLCADAGIMR